MILILCAFFDGFIKQKICNEENGMMNRFRWLYALILAFALVSCGGGSDDNDNSPSPTTDGEAATNITGTWTGNITTAGGTSSLQFSIVQTGTNVTGTLTIDGGDAPITNGKFENNIFTGGFEHDFGTIEYKISWQLVVGGTAMSGPMNGTMTLTSTPTPISTTWNGTAFLAKQ